MSSKFCADLDEVVTLSLATQGIRLSFYYEILDNLGIERNRSVFRIPGYKFAQLWNYLNIPFMFMYSGYDRDLHIEYILNRIEDGDYRFPFSKTVRSAYFASKNIIPIRSIPHLNALRN